MDDVRGRAGAILSGHKLRMLEEAGMTVVEKTRLDSLELQNKSADQYIIELINTSRDRDKTIAELAEYLQMVLNVSKDQDEALMGLLKLHRHPNGQKEFECVVSEALASERYSRIVQGENSGCLEGDETAEDRDRFMQRIARLRHTLTQIKGGDS